MAISGDGIERGNVFPRPDPARTGENHETVDQCDFWRDARSALICVRGLGRERGKRQSDGRRRRYPRGPEGRVSLGPGGNRDQSGATIHAEKEGACRREAGIEAEKRQGRKISGQPAARCNPLGGSGLAFVGQNGVGNSAALTQKGCLQRGRNHSGRKRQQVPYRAKVGKGHLRRKNDPGGEQQQQRLRHSALLMVRRRASASRQVLHLQSRTMSCTNRLSPEVPCAIRIRALRHPRARRSGRPRGWSGGGGR